MLRVVFDTNVLVSALANPSGTPGRVFDLWKNGKFDLIISDYILEELSRVLIEKIKLDKDFVTERVNHFRYTAHLVEPLPVFTYLVEEEDEPILGTAAAGKADYLVTGDKVLINLKHYASIPIIIPAQFLKKIKV